MDDDRKVPLSGDPSWPQRTAPLLQFLETPRMHKELEVWRSENKVPTYMLSQMLAWLEGKYLVYWNEDAKTWHKRFVVPLHKEVVVTKKKAKDLETRLDGAVKKGDKEDLKTWLEDAIKIKGAPKPTAFEETLISKSKECEGNDYKQQAIIAKRLAAQKASREKQKAERTDPEAKWPSSKGDLKWFARCADIAYMGPYDDQEAAWAATISVKTKAPVEGACVWCQRVTKEELPFVAVGNGEPAEDEMHKLLYDSVVARIPNMKMPRRSK
jgi:hypothetical protein